MAVRWWIDLARIVPAKAFVLKLGAKYFHYAAMEITWLNSAGKTCAAHVPNHVMPYVDAIGLDATVRLLLTLGGTSVSLPKHYIRDSALARVLTQEEVLTLSRCLGYGDILLPNASSFVSRCLRGQGKSYREIARMVRRTERTVQKYINGGPSGTRHNRPNRRRGT